MNHVHQHVAHAQRSIVDQKWPRMKVQHEANIQESLAKNMNLQLKLEDESHVQQEHELHVCRI